MERRAWVRFPKNEPMWCDPVRPSAKHELDTAWMGKVRDISRTGIGLSLRKRFEPGAVLLIELSESPKLLRNLEVRVVHATPDKKGRWIIGCTFARPLSAEEMQIFLPRENSK
jgi:PilZ domain